MALEAHRYKLPLESIPVDQVNDESTGWDNMVVRWIVTKDTVGSTDHVVGMTVFPPGSRHHFHRHPNAEEAQYIISGSGIARLGDVDIQQREGDTVFVPRNEIHGFWNNADTDCVMIWTYGGAASLEDAGFVRVDDE